MKNYLSKIGIFTFVASSLIFTSCSDDDVADTITINIKEVGSNNSGLATAGGDLHIEADLVATARIASVEIEMHHETDASAPKINVVFTEYAGQINAELHKHIDIPANQPAGDYHLHIKVIDANGNTRTAETEVRILASHANLFTINLTEIGHGTAGNFHAHAGEDMHIEGTISSTNPIASIAIEIHKTGAPDIEAVFTTPYAGQTSVNFHEHIDIPANQPTGMYHFHLVVIDNQGNEAEVEYDLEIE
jgi:hypothetical protein